MTDNTEDKYRLQTSSIDYEPFQQYQCRLSGVFHWVACIYFSRVGWAWGWDLS